MFDNLRAKLFGPKETVIDPNEEKFVEAAGAFVDADEDQWRRLTGDSNRDLSPMTQTRMQELAVFLWKSNTLANRLIELPIAYMLADGVSLSSSDPTAQDYLDAFWNDPINNMNIKLPKKVRELALYGEQCYPVFVNKYNGHVRLGYIDPGRIETVVTDPDNAEQPIGIVTHRNKKGLKSRFKVIVNGPETVFTKRTQQIRETFTDGECFYFSVNDLSNASRGHSDLLAQADYLDGYDQFLFGELERMNLLRAFLWDVTMKGATKEEVEARAREIGAPRPASVRVHNDSETWNAVTPGLGAADSNDNARLFRNHVLGGATVPEHWYGGGGDVNRATGESMAEPTQKVFAMRQAYLKYMLEEIATFVIYRRLDPTGPLPDPTEFDAELKPVAQFPEMTAKDTTKYAAALGQVVVACAAAIDRHLMTEMTALEMISAIAVQLGVDIDPHEELKAARAEAEQRREEDAFTGIDEDLEDDLLSDEA
ncbi:hypothetical protein [Magnetovibrio sp.]|uniref:hypothetical protein n=1 Tax=Magnetovibrio sp. TaxID=2024836 RepID=UPI002F9538E7